VSETIISLQSFPDHCHNSLSVYLGVPPPIQSSSSLAAVATMIETADLPETFAAQIEIQRHMARYLAVLTTDQHYTFNISAIKIFEVELDSISARFKTVWNAETECSLLIAKLSLFALACISNHATDQSISPSKTQTNVDQSLEVFKLSGLYFSSKLIHTYSEIVEEKAATTKCLLVTELQPGTAPSVCIPKRYTVSIYFATFFLLKFCAFNDRFSQNDRDMVKNNIKIAYDTFIRTSTHPLDEPGRTAQVVEVLSKSGDSDLRIKDRHIASLIYDSLQRAAELRGRQTDESIPEICLADEHPSGHNDAGEVHTDNADANPTSRPHLENLDPWVPYLGLAGDTWPLADLEAYNDDGVDSYITKNFLSYAPI
jgi:hypothetical protein